MKITLLGESNVDTACVLETHFIHILACARDSARVYITAPLSRE